MNHEMGLHRSLHRGFSARVGAGRAHEALLMPLLSPAALVSGLAG